jgi:hypothetical protein
MFNTHIHTLADMDDSQLLASIADQLRGLDELSDDDSTTATTATAPASNTSTAPAAKKKLDDILDELP